MIMTKRCPNCKSDLIERSQCLHRQTSDCNTVSGSPTFLCEKCGWKAKEINGDMRRNFREARRWVTTYLKEMNMISTRSNLNMAYKDGFSIGFVDTVLRGLEVNGIVKISSGLDNRTWIVLVDDLPPEEPRTRIVNISVTTDFDDMAFGILAPLALTWSEIGELRDLLGKFVDELQEDYESSEPGLFT